MSAKPTSRTHPSLTVLNDPILDKGTAYSEEEREALGITGLLPAHVDTLDTQISRVMSHLDAKQTDLERYIYLMSLCDRNEPLFFAVLMHDPVRFIPIGKLHLYTACAGVPPNALLPIHMDIGTTNRDLRDDPLYPGLHEDVASSDEIDALMDEFMRAANEVFPGVCIHFEDWKGTDALRLFDRYKNDYLIYNDDIQGTAGVTIQSQIYKPVYHDEAG
ncbi:hypothetical protein DL1_03845 [Thioclava dalianensis]|uniref:Malic enzyme N-terminal domain-containing protein n=1 Tax=Thioclava dalianensis TaxID=1185766 RepID=A0A074TCW9_9RHOB|nr:hypothetical protein [Thioclava dalianensis]KEP69549.1 hypothetical protein DL1_03845 [Thioclava dalianensis]SFN67062.1 Malic enzyme, N-terminal domain [Thioclava dalianensis]